MQLRPSPRIPRFREDVEPDDLEDQFVIEEEPEEVVMVDTDLMTEESEEPDSGENGKTDSAQEETFDPEFSDEDDDSFFAAEDDVSISEELQTEDVDTSETNIPALSASRFSSPRSAFATPPLYLSALTVATRTTASGFNPFIRHLISKNFSAPRSAPNPASVMT